MRIYSPDPQIIRYGVIYLRWLLPTYFFTGLSLTCTIVLRTVGLVQIPLYTSIAAFFVNVFFNWVFIFGKLGAPRMEIAGAALGTLIARIFELGCICGWFFCVDKRIHYRLKDLFMRCGDMVREYIRTSGMTEEEREELVEAVNQIKNNETPTTLMQAPITSLNVTF